MHKHRISSINFNNTIFLVSCEYQITCYCASDTLPASRGITTVHGSNYTKDTNFTAPDRISFRSQNIWKLLSKSKYLKITIRIKELSKPKLTQKVIQVGQGVKAGGDITLNKNNDKKFETSNLSKYISVFSS